MYPQLLLVKIEKIVSNHNSMSCSMQQQFREVQLYISLCSFFLGGGIEELQLFKKDSSYNDRSDSSFKTGD